MPFRFSYGRKPTMALHGMVATSQATATRAGLRMLERGGNAADAAVAAAAMLCVTEPMSTGLGGDAFAIVWHDGNVEALDAAGPAPGRAEPLEPVAQKGPRSVTVPGAVAGWAALAERHGQLGLDRCLEDAIDAAEGGFAVAARTAAVWQALGGPFGPPPAVGDVASPPRPGAALGLLERSSPGIASQIRCVQLALEDALARVRDGADVSELLTPAYLDARRGRAAVTEPAGGTVYLCVVDRDRMAVSFIQSLFEG